MKNVRFYGKHKNSVSVPFRGSVFLNINLSNRKGFDKSFRPLPGFCVSQYVAGRSRQIENRFRPLPGFCVSQYKNNAP